MPRHTLVLLAALFTSGIVHAGKPEKPGGGGTGPAYTILPFAPLGADSQDTNITDLNDVGEVIGIANTSGSTTYWRLDLLSGAYTQLPGLFVAINNAGQMVGQTADDRSGLFQHDPGAAPVFLPPLPGDDQSVVQDINDDGFIVGWSKIAGTAPTTAVAWRAVVDAEGDVTVTGPVPLSPRAGDESSFGLRVNDPLAGPVLVMGGSRVGNSREAVVWPLGVDADGELLGGPPTGLGTLGLIEETYSAGYGLNGFGDVCGQSDLLPFVFPAGGAMQALPVPRNTFFSYARDINDPGAIVGHHYISYQKGARIVHEEYPFLWRPGSDPIDLNKLHNDPAWAKLWHAFRITNSGVITGRGRYDGADRGFIIIPNQ